MKTEEQKEYTCFRCKRTFTGRKRKYCGSECAEAANKAQQRFYRNKVRKERIANMDIAQISALARKQHMSYGQYIAKLYAEDRRHDIE